MEDEVVIRKFAILSFFLLCLNFSGKYLYASGIESENQYTSATSHERLKYWKKVADRVNKDVPFNIDQTTILKSVDALEDGLSYNIILVSPVYDKFKSESEIADFLDKVREDSAKRQCARKDKFFINIKARLKTVYYRKDGSYFGEFYYIAGEGCY